MLSVVWLWWQRAEFVVGCGGVGRSDGGSCSGGSGDSRGGSKNSSHSNTKNVLKEAVVVVEGV